MKYLFKSKVDIIQSIIIGILAIAVILGNFSIIAQFFGRLNPLVGYQAKIEELEGKLKDVVGKNKILELDRIRLEDATNILLAIQDYYFLKNAFPETLEVLQKEKYLDQTNRLADPSTNKPYYYKKREQDFVFCVWLSDMLKGVNTKSCYPETNGESGDKKTQENGNKESQLIEKKLQIIGDVPVVNVRQQPTTESEIIAQVEPGDSFVFTEQQGDWYRIIMNERKEGWVNKNYARP